MEHNGRSVQSGPVQSSSDREPSTVDDFTMDAQGDQGDATVRRTAGSGSSFPDHYKRIPRRGSGGSETSKQKHRRINNGAPELHGSGNTSST